MKLVNVVLFFDIISVIRNKIYLFFFCLQYGMHHKSSFTPKVVYWKTWRELGVQPFFLRQAIMQQRIKASVTKCLPLKSDWSFCQYYRSYERQGTPSSVIVHLISPWVSNQGDFDLLTYMYMYVRVSALHVLLVPGIIVWCLLVYASAEDSTILAEK